MHEIILPADISEEALNKVKNHLKGLMTDHPFWKSNAIEIKIEGEEPLIVSFHGKETLIEELELIQAVNMIFEGRTELTAKEQKAINELRAKNSRKEK